MTTKATPPAEIPLDALVMEYACGEWGYTGTRAGMSGFQKQIIQHALTLGQPAMFRHGGAYGGDTEAHRAWKRTCKESKANVWPADEKRAAIFRGDIRTVVEVPMPPLDRNVIIVTKSQFMLAAPHTEQEIQQSGTWHTIRQALKRDKPILIVWPRSQRITLYRGKTLYRVSFAIRETP
jgi:hypothetical protein